MIFCAAEFYVLPISHIHIIYVLRQPMLVVLPIDPIWGRDRSLY